MYEPNEIERKWQSYWEEHGTNQPDLESAERPFFNLMMYPYPSAEGLHVGNLYAFTGADIYGRYRRLGGEDVFEPIGYDAFGIHSENHALRVNIHPMELIPANIANFERMLRRAGLMYDWSHTVDTTDPDYYRWTQWIFIQLFNAGLAVKKEAPVNWCPKDQTVLANEQVIAGRCERCDTPVEQRQLSQWFFRITEYTERLLGNLEWIDWSETTRTAQRNWIGRSEGAQLWFPVPGAEGETIEVFTTRPDTIYGATFMVLAPEHPLVDRVTSDEQRATVEEYQRTTAATDLVERRKIEEKDKSGVFTGGYATNPATGEPVPIWVADYVLMEYGTGAIMAVPGHDQRDFEFARRFGLPIVPVVSPREGLESDVDPAAVDLELEEAFIGHTEDEILINSDRFSGMEADAGGHAIVEWLAERDLATPHVNYRLHDWCISRQRYWGPPIPIIYCDDCGVQAVPEEDLPVRLPYVEDFRPDASGISPLARVEEFYRTACPKCGGEARRETDVSDTFLDSGWYFLRYPSTDFDDCPFNAERTRKWLPVDMYIGGEEHAVLHLLYSRFLTMVLHDLGHVEFEEPYHTFQKHGLLIKEGAKISKSRGNVILPDEYIERFGADVFRAYLMFLGPFQVGGDFRDVGLAGPARFLKKVWDSVTSAISAGRSGFDDENVERALHATIKKVTEDLESLNYNTAIAALMDYLNQVRAEGRVPSLDEVQPLVILMAPIAPHIAEELWERLGGEPSVFENGRWPTHDVSKLEVDELDIPVQVNGKLRATIRVARGASQETVQEAALQDDNVRRQLNGAEIRKVVHVPDRLINLVVA
jgi:leucyl-tRNA synthetase